MTLTRNKKITILAIVIIILFLGSVLMNSIDKSANYYTGSDYEETASRTLSITDMATSESMVVGDIGGSAYDINETDQYVIKTGSLNLVVEHIETAADEITAIASSYGGTVTDKYIYSYGDSKSGTVELTVDEANFNAAISAIKEIAQSVTSENVSADDVTEQVIDVQARLENARAEETAYLNILNQATSVEDILNVQFYLSNVREEIERYESQLEYYETHTSYSTISVYLEEATSIVLDSDEFRPLQTVKDSLQAVIRLFQGLILGLIEFIIVGGAVIIPILILFFGGRWIYRRYKK